ncbi:phosphohydrolase [Wenxinia marina]|uniref:Metal dependent phosphohydrolase n=2 Tax=Wenxinia TaxID=653686 RepID=A0A0D0P794_9RHOB|nr:metal dependent phosphohydrolase [Wenxinia marina DSM 24838]GGL69349.1 phosphohydrolase [Wenxinia marina]
MLRRITAAAHFAARIHADQRRRGASDVPYVNHVIEVAALVAEAGGEACEVIAALLHDVVEDSDTTLDEIEESFGSDVARLVDGMTDSPEWEGLPRPERKRRQAEHMKTAPDGVRRIKIADQTSNVRDIVRLPEAWTDDDPAQYLEGAERVVDACRGAAPWLEAAFDAAAAEAMQKIGGKV